jgi:hypothetical protein
MSTVEDDQERLELGCLGKIFLIFCIWAAMVILFVFALTISNVVALFLR